MIPREVLGDRAYQIPAAADTHAKGWKKAVVFFSERTRAMARNGMTWRSTGPTGSAALAELENGGFPGLYLTISERATRSSATPRRGIALRPRASVTFVRASIAGKLREDWPPFMRGGLDAAG